MTPYTFYYWPLPFRGNFIRCILEYKNIPYDLASTESLMALRKSSDEFNPPFMAPPLLHDKELDVYISQMPAIVNHLSRKHGLDVGDDKKKQAVGEMMVGNCNDVLEEITRHGGSQMWDNEEAWKGWSTGRFVKWMGIFEESGKRLSDGDDCYYLGTKEVTFADIANVALWITMERGFPKLSPVLRENMPRVMSICDRVISDSEGLKNFFEGQSSVPYCGGQIEKSIRSVLEKE